MKDYIDKMLEIIECKVELELLNRSDFEYKVTCRKNGIGKRIELIVLPDPHVPAREYMQAEEWLAEYKDDIKRYLVEATSLKWEYAESFWYFDFFRAA